ncbi:methyltransferase domain protein [Ancylostoma ceylanicum]|uniref:Methyltransferase domain protein n=1 Tax=Ancylostoma ceylanicum TaxID=53326 RepID=A0A0D6M4A4_9BILA|nr:methyltransferase domain protein [Ancylostoma ceylanicum]
MLSSFLPVFMRGYDKITEVFGKEGPLGLKYSDFSDFYVTMASFSEALHKKHLISDFIPALGSDMKERLENGGMMCLDVGCGKGFHAALLAETFPKSNFTGIDVTLEAVHLANQQRKDNGQTFDNLAFIQMDAGKMDADWENKYDVVTIFDACHDQMRPDLVNGSSNVYKDKKEMGLVATQMYGCSMFHCLPVSSNSEDALGLGAMWGKERAVKLLKEAGFKDITVLPTPQFVINILYVCKKD